MHHLTQYICQFLLLSSRHLLSSKDTHLLFWLLLILRRANFIPLQRSPRRSLLMQFHADIQSFAAAASLILSFSSLSLPKCPNMPLCNSFLTFHPSLYVSHLLAFLSANAMPIVLYTICVYLSLQDSLSQHLQYQQGLTFSM